MFRKEDTKKALEEMLEHIRKNPIKVDPDIDLSALADEVNNEIL